MAILLAAYNGLAFIEAQLTSILNQPRIVVTVYISVDYSSDGTYEWCVNFSQVHPNVHILTYGEKFGGAARNFFRLIRDVDFSEFDYVAFSDQDDIWFPEKLERSVQQLISSKSDAYSSNVIAWWPSGKKVLIKKSQAQRTWDYLFEAAGPGCTYVLTVGLAMALKIKLVKDNEEIKKLVLHDWFTYAFARASGYKWFIDEQPGMLYRQHAENQVGVNSGWRAFLFRVKTVLSGWGFEQTLLTAKLVGASDREFVLRWSKLDRRGFLLLAFSANQCRRRLSDRFLFFIACVLRALLGSR